MKANQRIRLGIVIALLEILALCAVAYPQVKSGPIAVPPAGPAPPETASGQTQKMAGPPPARPLVSLDVLVTDEDGLILAGLKKNDFRVLDNGKAQTITHFEPVGAPITIVMLMESSASAYSYFVYKATSWGSRFLDHLEPQDYVALVIYDIQPTVRVDFTRNKARVQEALAAYSFAGFREANLYDALIDTLERLGCVKGKTAILIVGTGSNTMSRSTLDETLRDGKYHRLKVEVIGPDGKPLMVTSPQGKRRKVVVYAREGYMAPRGDTRE
ncbi:MAG TPA: hypothetical protein VNJ12_13520 [Candidatus Dormibacteraeota bacterium]|nr:hypothetical protein [Candidatus Dormibacteraeota bacterium]